MSTEKLIYLPVGVLTAVTMVSGAVLGGAGGYAMEQTGSPAPMASVTIAGACSLTAGSGDGYTSTVVLSGTDGDTTTDNNKPSMTATCNDPEGFAIFAVGASDAVDENTTYMVGPDANIPTGTSGDSYWAMKVTPKDSNTTVESPYNNWAPVPNTNTAIVKVTAATNGAATSSVRADYRVHVGNNLPAGTYVGKVKYTLVHPSTATPTN